jgi:hypothetical protein
MRVADGWRERGWGLGFREEDCTIYMRSLCAVTGRTMPTH